MASITAPLFIATLCVFTFLQIEVHSFSTTQDCVGTIVKQIEEKRSELATEYLKSNQQTSGSLLQICEYYVPHKVHKVLQLVNKETCNAKIPSTGELQQSIYDSYVQLLNQLRIYEGLDIPNSFGQFNDRVVGMTKAIFDRTVDELAGRCLHINAEQIE